MRDRDRQLSATISSQPAAWLLLLGLLAVPAAGQARRAVPDRIPPAEARLRKDEPGIRMMGHAV